MSSIKDENFFQISGFMINRLNLKGISLMVYAIIYGFSQDGQSEFTGSRKFLCDFTGTTKPTIDKALNELCENNLIIKFSEVKNGVVFNRYKVNLDFTTSKETLPPSKETLSGGGKETLPNNKDNIININNNIKENKKEKIDEIVNYLNKKTGKHYRNNGKTAELIEARLNDDYTVDDFKHVIDVKCQQWLGYEMEKFLRPETLFNRTKFESYLNEELRQGVKNNPIDLPNGGFQDLMDEPYVPSDDNDEELLF